MTTAGTQITTSDYNGIQSTISNILGPVIAGTNYGYGQTISSSQLTTGGEILAAPWQNLYADLSKVYAHQNGSTPSQTVLPPVSPGTVVSAALINSYVTVANNCYTNRFICAVGNSTITAPSTNTTSTRTTTWGSGSSGITCAGTFTWPTEAAATMFFNTGGFITINMAHPTTSTAQDSAWNTFLSNYGTIKFGGFGATTTGSGTITLPNLSYFSLTTSASAIINSVAMPITNYTSNYVSVYVTKITNGLSVTVLLEDNSANSSDSVASGTNVGFGWSRATDTQYLPTTSVDPSFLLTNGLAGVNSTLSLSQTATSVVANGTNTVTFTAKLKDANGNAVSGYQINWSTTLGTLSATSSTTDSTGSAAVVLTAPSSSGTATVTASSALASATGTVTFNPNVQISSLTAVDSSGQNRYFLATATVVDGSGNPVNGASITWNIGPSSAIVAGYIMLETTGYAAVTAPYTTTTNSSGQSQMLVMTYSPSSTTSYTISVTSGAVSKTISITPAENDGQGAGA